MTSCPEACVFWKKKAVEIWDWMKRVGIRISVGPVQLFAAGCTRVCWVSELRADAGRTVSIVKIVSLSPRDENLKVKKVIKVSYLNQESRQCFAGFLCMWTFNTSVYRHYVHFTYSLIMAMLQCVRPLSSQPIFYTVKILEWDLKLKKMWHADNEKKVKEKKTGSNWNGISENSQKKKAEN